MNGKQAAGYLAADWVKDGMTVGLGTGSTAYWAIERLGQRVAEGLLIQAIATSSASEELARKYHIPMIEAAQVDRLDLAIDGADEVDHELQLIKGGGGALLREKLVALQADHFIVVADDSKKVDQLGVFKLPIEIVPFSYEWTLRKLRSLYPADFQLRQQDTNQLYVTDNGNYIVDAAFGRIEDAALLAQELDHVTGVVEHGLFIDITQTLVLGFADGHTEVIEKK
ncbi:ribose 5-phosphate isomerase A [Paenibacillus shirakamiensis]|uniref:Ribose-5-phosphate isomerase A n=1 Tax=Paenibacillus shirakamiensis TaxID=1265935 RepID=A0ABS4JHL1_9BACL|nr:ribose-5-phosphate isomerase RpiA [Paenibacillus shirakamiensis]MBP2001197.1 ribose 5-phosphate isomerase A [Paenibacillus shirakamiensis]